MAPDGTATVIWVGNRGVMSREAAPGEPWKPAEAIPGTRDASGLEVLAGVDKRGTVTAVWTRFRYDDAGDEWYSFWSADHAAGGRWSRPVRLGGGPAGDVGPTNWDLAVSRSGAAVFAWSPEEFSGPMRATYRPKNGGWSSPEPMPGSPSDFPVVTIDADGLATVAHLREGRAARGRDLLTLVQGSAEGWQEPLNLDAAVAWPLFDIDAAGSGEVVVVWQAADRRFVTGRVRGGVMTDEHPLMKAGERSDEGQVAASADGSAQFIWSPSGNGPKDLHAVQQSPSGAPGEPEAVGPMSWTWETYLPVLDRNDRGDSILAWSGPNSALQVAYKSGGADTWSSHTDAVPYGSGPNFGASPTVSIADDGSTVLTWENYHSDPDELEATDLLARRATLSR
jgi:hypothetical protein